MGRGGSDRSSAPREAGARPSRVTDPTVLVAVGSDHVKVAGLLAALRGAALVFALALAGAAGAQVVAVGAAGDVACDPASPDWNGGNGTASGCRMKATSDLLLAAGLDRVLVLGDTQYEDAAAAKYLASYDPTWGRLKGITLPVVGNHEYLTPGAAGYFGYFGAAAGDPAKGWYSTDVGAWHVVVLNGNCASVGGCGAGSPQHAWLVADLAAHPGVCTLAAWHQPRFSSGPHGDDPAYDAFWRALHAAGADVVLNGHDHVYERFGPQTPDGAPDAARGLRQFVVGTGGKNLTSFGAPRPNSEARAAAFGVLKLTLRPASYSWEFRPATPGAFSDTGFSFCHARRPAAFHALAPCRLADTRATGGALGPGTRDVAVAGVCGVPDGATGVALNVTAVDATADGSFRVGPAGLSLETTTLPFRAGRTRAVAAVAAVGANGSVGVEAELPAGGSAHLLLDVAGWLE